MKIFYGLHCFLAIFLGCGRLIVGNKVARLEEPCDSNTKCQPSHSQCINGHCECQPYYVKYNNECLQSLLLTSPCILDEQCSKKVLNSECNSGKCQCKKGFISFRKHTCLSPARPGEICYNDEHCKLWSNASYCDFSIGLPNLFGSCKCLNSQGAKCEEPLPITTTEEGKTTAVIDVDYDEVFEDKILKTESPKLNEANMYQEALKLFQKSNIRRSNINSKYRDAIAQSFQYFLTPYQTSKKASTVTRTEENILALTLGYPCQNSMECTLADPFSTCKDGVCECLHMQNTSNSCNSYNTGCPSDTFQCRRSGFCVSWFFVCDGREDCPDGSDEDCDGPVCPAISFQCGASGPCFSRAVVCDGKVNCANGEDELDCAQGDRNITNCPQHTFRCANGQCVPEYEFCNAIPSCTDRSDEPEDLCRSNRQEVRKGKSTYDTCPFRCRNGRCRSTAIVCSGRDGCGDNSDEDNCTVCRCPAPT